MSTLDHVTMHCPDCGFSARVAAHKIPPTMKFAVCPKCKVRFPIIRQQRSSPAKTSRPPRPVVRPVPAWRRLLTLRTALVLLAVLGLFAGAGAWWSRARTTAPPVAAKLEPVEGVGAPTAVEPPEPAPANNQPIDLIRAIAAGSRHAAVVRSDGSLWVWGDNEFAQLGTGEQGRGSSVPVHLAGSGFVSVAAGTYHTLALKGDGSVWGWGENESGQVGCDSDVTSILRPKQLPGLAGVKALAAGQKHSLALMVDGTVMAWGGDMNGQLGTPASDQTSRRPIPVPFLRDIVAIAAGSDHSLALKKNGTVYIWGGVFPALPGKIRVQRTAAVAVPDLPNIVAIAAGELDSIALDASGTVWRLERKLSFTPQEKKSMSAAELQAAALRITPRKIDNFGPVTAIAAGNNYFLARLEDGTVYGWGSNRMQELAQFNKNYCEAPVPIKRYRATSPSTVKANDMLPLGDIRLLTAGGTTAFAVDAAGTVWSWGDNYYGQRGIDQGVKYVLPWPVSNAGGMLDPASVANAQSLPMPMRSTTELASLRPKHRLFAGGYRHTLFIDQNQAVWAWGDNEGYRIGRGLGFARDQKEPVRAKLEDAGPVVEVAANCYHSVALGADGSVWVWGMNPNITTEKPGARRITGNIEQIAAGRNFFLILDHDGVAYRFGGNYAGTIEHNKTIDEIYTPTAIPLPVRISQVAAGAVHALALDTNGTVYAWGLNDSGQLGDGSTTGHETPLAVRGLDAVVAIAAGSSTSLALQRDGTVWAWGDEVAADFNGQTRRNSPTPVRVAGLDHVVAVACGGLLSSGPGHNLALKEDGTVWAWGNNHFGQIGDGTIENSRSRPVQVAELSDVVAIVAGDGFSLALRADGALLGWGSNWGNQLGSMVATVTIPRRIEGVSRAPAL